MVHCSILGCNNDSARKTENISFHRFPKDATALSWWVKATGHQAPDWQPHKGARVCSKHFQTQCFRHLKNKTMLNVGSVPMLYVHNSDELNEISKSQSSSSSCNCIHATSLRKSYASIGTQTMPITEICSSSLAVPNALERSRLQSQIGDTANNTTPRKKKLVRKLLRTTKLAKARKSQIAVLRSRNWRLQKKNAKLSCVIEELKAGSFINQENADALKAIDPVNQDILKKVAGATAKHQYSPSLRKFALTLHFISPRAYDFVRKTFDTCLPHPRTLSRWYQSVDGEPGFSKESLQALKLLSKDSSKQLYAALCFDEMGIRKRVEWDGQNYTGFVNTGNNVNRDVLPIAKEALTFMLTCVNGSWKIPLGYFNINSISAEQKATLVKQCLDLVEDCGIHVISVTFDGCPANFSMAKVLGCKVDGEAREISPTFEHNGKTVVVFPDPSHMIKLVRNTLGDKKNITTAEGEPISWDYVQSLVDLQENEGLHLANKLSKSHTNFRKQVMKVKLAAQVFSDSVADALEFCRDDLNLEEFSGCRETVTFIRTMNSLFDIMNSRNLTAYAHKKPLSEKNFENEKKFLEYVYNYIKGLKLEGIPILECKRKTGFNGFLVCIRSVLFLYDNYVQTKKIAFLCTYKLNQDHLECFFSAIRAKGGFNNNPTTRQFRAAFKRMLVHGELKHIATGNCVALEDISILTATLPEMALNATSDDWKSFHRSSITVRLG